MYLRVVFVTYKMSAGTLTSTLQPGILVLLPVYRNSLSGEKLVDVLIKGILSDIDEEKWYHENTIFKAAMLATRQLELLGKTAPRIRNMRNHIIASQDSIHQQYDRERNYVGLGYNFTFCHCGSDRIEGAMVDFETESRKLFDDGLIPLTTRRAKQKILISLVGECAF